jgi:hypothetical protein
MRTGKFQVSALGRRLGRETDGSVLLEGALVVSLLLTLLIGIFWLGRGYNAYQTITRAAREGARFAIAPTCATCGNQYPTDLEIQGVIDAALQASSLDRDPANPIIIQRGQVLNPGSSPQETGVVITFNYPFEIFLPFTTVGLSTLTLTTQVQMREEK